MNLRVLRYLAVPAVLLPFLALAQEAQGPACAAAEYRQFDFWVGEWRVENADGEQVGTNRIERVLNDCALHESWVGGGGGHGFSYNIYDARSGTWHQTWVDDRGRLLQLDGGMEGESMVLSGSRPGPDGSTILDRISWEEIDGGRVRQVWSISQDAGTSWNIIFDGTYVPAD